MSKVKVQEATKELGITAGQLLEEITQMKTQSYNTHHKLKRLQDEILQREEIRREEERQGGGEDSVPDISAPPQADEAAVSSQTPPVEAVAKVTPPPIAQGAGAEAQRLSAAEIRANARAARKRNVAANETESEDGSENKIPAVSSIEVVSLARERTEPSPKKAEQPQSEPPQKAKAEPKPAEEVKNRPAEQRPVRDVNQRDKTQGRPAQQQLRTNTPQAGGARPANAQQQRTARPSPQNQSQPIVTRDGRILPPRGVEGRVFSKEPVKPAAPVQQAGAQRSAERFPPREARPFEGRQGERHNEGQGFRQPFQQRDRADRPPFQKDEGLRGGPRQGGTGFGGPRPGGPGGPRPAGGTGPRPGMGRPGGGGRKSGPELTPTVEKERVSNYDPNKKSYDRPKDNEATKKTRKQLNRNQAPHITSDDDFYRGKKKKKQQLVHKPEPIKIEKAYMTAETITVKDLTERIGKPAGEIIKKLLILGVIATINQELDYDTAQLVSKDFGVDLELKLEQTAEEALEAENVEDRPEDLIIRPPVVTIMGHVDHGKTSLLDTIRSAHVTEGEAGGITQHIGAYTVDVNGQSITFLDTPGHEAFTAMRARGAQATDIAVLVIGADDGVMPQTVEAINHAKAANVPIIVAINKIDRPDANIDKVKQELTEYELLAEEWGGSTVMVPVSAKQNMNIGTLLEMILLVAEMQDLKANPNRKARGVIIEAKLDKGRGPVATVLIQSGTLHIGETILAGTAFGRVRAMVNDRGARVTEAGPSQPVEVIGFNDVPDAGDILYAADNERLSRLVADERLDKIKVQQVKASNKVSLDDLYNQIAEGQIKDLNVIIKADVQGSVEAVKQALEKIANEEVRVRAIHGGVGAINEADITFATASNAIIVGFNVRPNNMARAAAEREKVDVRLYRVIYHAIEDIENAMKGMLAPKFREVTLGHIQVRQVFRITGVGTVAGSYVTEGKVQRNAQVRLVRDGIVIFEGKIDSLKRHKDDAREVMQGYECGIGLEGYNDVKMGDEIECYITEKIEV